MFKDLRNLQRALIVLFSFFLKLITVSGWREKKKKEWKGFKALNKGDEMIYCSAYLYHMNFLPKKPIMAQHQEIQQAYKCLSFSDCETQRTLNGKTTRCIEVNISNILIRLLVNKSPAAASLMAKTAKVNYFWHYKRTLQSAIHAIHVFSLHCFSFTLI